MTGWDIRADSPLLGLDGRRRARFAVAAAPGPPPAEVDRLLAGAAEADLTPPPGMPKAGYSTNAHDGNGFRTRLRARVLHLRSGTCSLALVQCDLLGGSAVLQHLVARAVASRTDLPLAGLFVGATHTHAAPGQFLGTDFYNRFASNRSGFDPAWSQGLVESISDAVSEAVATRGPARMACGVADVWGLTRNRSLDPHVANASVSDKRTAPQRKFAAVNPRLHLIRVDRAAPDGGTEPLAATVVFSVHGTGIDMGARDYNADLWAYLVGELADRVERSHGRRPVAGAIEGTHADVAPAIRPGAPGHLEARRVGREMGAAAAELYDRLGERLTDRVPLAAHLRDVDLDRSSTIDGVTLPDRPAVGAALVAGAKENLTPVIGSIPPFRAGHPKRWDRGPQGAKWVLGSRWLQPVVLPRRGFPRVLPVHAVRLGSLLLIGLPFEVTVEAGRRVERAVGTVAPDGVTEVAVSSVANEYCGYVTTAEEYARQFYEGGHTLYGPATQEFLARHAVRAAAGLAGGGAVHEGPLLRRFDLHARRYLPPPDGVAVRREVVSPAAFTDPTPRRDGYWETEWRDVAPGDLYWARPLIRVDARDRGDGWRPARRQGRPVDDAGWDIEVTHLGADRGAHRYRARWHDPELRGDRAHRFVFVANAGQPELAGEQFD